MKSKSLLLTILGTCLLSACTWVKMTPEGEKVRVLSQEDVATCKKLGKVHAALKDKVAGVDRNQEKVRLELETLARNHAGTLNGDTVVPVSDIVEGKQTYEVYRCVNPGS